MQTPQAGGRASGQSAAAAGAVGLIDLAKNSYRNGKPASEDAVIRDRIMQMVIRQEAFKQTARRGRVQALTDHPMRIPLAGKLVITEMMQDTAALALEIEGAASSLYLADENAPESGQWPLAYMNSYGGTIAAGTSEVQRNILGERVLGLAKSK